ncbi:MAG: class I SAM-dependent methyltransferase [Salibacteraceae bacterium]
MGNNLTEREFWLNYWENKTDLVKKVESEDYFIPLFDKVVKDFKPQTAIEIGGFPGYQSIFLKKKHKVSTTLLDYVVHTKRITELLEFNGLKADDISCIETDLFSYEPEKKYDLVFSIGFIEHFRDTKNLLEIHSKYLSENGTLLIIVPNFLGVNGWMNKTFDRANFDKHFLDCMDKDNLEELSNEIGLNVVSSEYYGGFSIWLENMAKKSGIFKLIFKSVWIVGKVFSKILRKETQLLSPYTILIARKK